MKPIRRSLFFALWLFIHMQSHAQTPYFQQDVDYRIAVLLDDEQHFLHGQLEIRYRNNAPQALDSLYFHLWPNAYRDNQTAFAQQQRQHGNLRFHYAPPEDRGYIDSLRFEAEGQPIAWGLDTHHADIAGLKLAQPLLPGAEIIITTPFRVKLPRTFSRLGHEGQAYQITQWYPKPAVFDREGWHAMPYLDMGEFYSEFGSFDLSITLPENYLVAATGMLQTPSEKAFLEEQIARSAALLDTVTQGVSQAPFPPSSPTLKTIRYTAEQVHDFAWFADKRFLVQKELAILPSGRSVEAWAFFPPDEQHLWKQAAGYVSRALVFYSELVGEYPYPQATAVQTALSAGGGMEYPMVTNISLMGDAQGVDEVITHEVGHNWFYGILASNERRSPWMDEGMNSYYDHRYSRQHYDGPDLSYLPDFVLKKTELDMLEIAYLYQARRRLNQAPQTPSEELSRINYFLSAYEIPARAFRYLESYLGTARFDAIMQGYYEQWKFRHPRPEDFQEHVEGAVGRPLPWFFDGLIFSNQRQDYAIAGIKTRGDSLQVRLRNKGRIAGPFVLSAMAGGEPVYEFWVEGFEGRQEITLPAGRYDEIILDREHITFDLYRQDNRIRTQGWFKKFEPLSLQYLAGVESNSRTAIYWTPLLSWNDYDKAMPGLLLHNRLLPEKRLEWALAPFWGTNTQALTGLGGLHYNFYPQSPKLQRLAIGIQARSFQYRSFAATGQAFRFARWQPYLRLDLAVPATSALRRQVLLRNIWLQYEYPDFAPDGEPLPTIWRTGAIQELSYSSENRRKLNPYHWRIALEHQDHRRLSLRSGRYLKSSLEYRQAFAFERGRNIHLRFFAGAFLYNSNRGIGAIEPWAFNLTAQGFNDYRYDDFYLGRSDAEGLWLQQVSIREGGFKNVIGRGFNLGRSNSFILAANFKADLPRKVLPKLPIKPYFDIGYFDNTLPTGQGDSFKDQLLWSGGLMIDIADEAFALYFPLINSANIQDRYAERGSYWRRIAFAVDLHRFNPWKAIDRLEF